MPDKSFSPHSILITGGAGFVGSNLARWLLEHDPSLDVVVLDALTYAGNLESILDLRQRYGPDGERRFSFVRGDVRDPAVISALLAGSMRDPDSGRALPPPDALLHLAAESHVDRSIESAANFVSTNVQGTLVLLECTRRELDARARPFRFVNVSTDEVYGSLGPDDPPFSEESPLRPSSPYAASKAGADCLVRAYAETFALPCLTTRCANNYGPYQLPEKLIPLVITRALDDQPLPLYGDGMNVRDWLHVSDHAAGIWAVCTRGYLEDRVYHIGAREELPNIDVVTRILEILGKPESLITYTVDRPGHDRRYATDATRIESRLGWRPRHSFADGLRETVEWYIDNEWWWRDVQSEAYRSAEAMYLRMSSRTNERSE